MTRTIHSPRSRGRRKFLVQKPRGQFTSRVQAVGPEHFGIVTVDCAKARSKFMLADFFGTVHVPPTVVVHRQGELQAAIERIRQALSEHDLRDFVVAIERTGEYHRPVQRLSASSAGTCGWSTPSPLISTVSRLIPATKPTTPIWPPCIGPRSTASA